MEDPKKECIKRLSEVELTELLLRSYKFIRIYDAIYVYDNKKGYYQNLQGADAPQIIRTFIPNSCRVYVTSKTIYEIIEWLKAMDIKDHTSEFITHSCRYINFIDSVYDLNTDQILDHSDSFILTSYNNVALRKKKYINAAPTFSKVLSNLITTRSIRSCSA